MDWSGCPIVEVNPRKVSGAPILVGTSVQADSVPENFQDGSPIEEITDSFSIPAEMIEEILRFALRDTNRKPE